MSGEQTFIGLLERSLQLALRGCKHRCRTRGLSCGLVSCDEQFAVATVERETCCKCADTYADDETGREVAHDPR